MPDTHGNSRRPSYVEEAQATLELFYENHDVQSTSMPSTARLLESIAESLVSIAQSLETTVRERKP
jgi:hypothetical protein